MICALFDIVNYVFLVKPYFLLSRLMRFDNAGGHDSQDYQCGTSKVTEDEHACSSRGIQLEAINLLKNKKLRQSNLGV